MFTVKTLGQDNQKLHRVHGGMTFGFLGKEIYFEVTTTDVATPLRISFVVKSDESKPSVTFEVGKIVNASLALAFYNPPNSGKSGITSPIAILQSITDSLHLMFKVETSWGSECYELTYEFYEAVELATGGWR